MKRICLLLAVFLLGVTLCVASTGAPPVQTCDSSGFTSNTGGTPCTFSSNTTAGNAIICFAFTQETAEAWDVSMPGEAGFWRTPLGAPERGATTSAYAAFLLNIVGGQTTVTAIWNLASITGDYKCAEYHGLTSLDSIIGQADGGTGTGTSLTASNITTGYANDLIVVGGGIKTGSETFTAGSGYTVEKQRGGGTQSEFIEDQNASTAGSYSVGATVGTSGEFSILALAFSTTAAAWSPPTYTNPFTIVTTATDIDANQGIASTGSLDFTTACYGTCSSSTQQWTLTSFSMDSNGLPTGSPTQTRNCQNDAPSSATIAQLTGIFYRPDTNDLIVTANSFANTSVCNDYYNCTSYAMEYNPTSLSSGPTASHTLNADSTEGVSWNPHTGTYWAYYYGGSWVDEYSSSWTLVKTHGLPVAPAPTNPTSGGTWAMNYGQAFIWDISGTIAYANPHNQNADHRVYIYRYDGTNFHFLGYLPQAIINGSGPQSGGTGQGMFFWGQKLYWVDRTAALTGKITVQPWQPGTLYGVGNAFRFGGL